MTLDSGVCETMLANGQKVTDRPITDPEILTVSVVVALDEHSDSIRFVSNINLARSGPDSPLETVTHHSGSTTDRPFHDRPGRRIAHRFNGVIADSLLHHLHLEAWRRPGTP